MSSPANDTEEASSSCDVIGNGRTSDGGDAVVSSSESARPPAKRRLSATVIEISDTESDDSDICAVNTYQASADEVKRIRGDYSSSSSSYSSDSESGCEDDSRVLPDTDGAGGCGRGALLLRAGRTDDPLFNPQYKDPETIDKLTTHWKESKDYSSEDVTLTCEPFRLCLLHNFLENSEFINNIVDDMNTLDWSRKKMDLYEFHQTADLASLTWQRSIRGIHRLLETDVMTWVSGVTGLRLEAVSASCSLYGPGDHLLVHDDLLADRRVAFVFYLAPWSPRRAPAENGSGEGGGGGAGWLPDMGGALELLARDPAGRPERVARTVVPANNTLAFFAVGTDSFHQVGEVTSLELPRLSINGWFHGPAPETEVASGPSPEPEPPILRPNVDPVPIGAWLQPAYMTPRARAQVQAQMERDSEVSLCDFLLQDRYQALVEALRGPEVPWEACGPADRRRHSRLPTSWLESRPEEHPARGLLRLLTCVSWFRVLTECTDLVCTGYRGLELQRWSPGDYTLLPPRSRYLSARLELVLYLGSPLPPRAVSGGSTTYVAPEDAGALVTLPPRSNALSLVYCDPGAASFTKYLSRMTMSPLEHLYIVTCAYSE